MGCFASDDDDDDDDDSAYLISLNIDFSEKYLR
jgi:hypothetical protein